MSASTKWWSTPKDNAKKNNKQRPENKKLAHRDWANRQIHKTATQTARSDMNHTTTESRQHDGRGRATPSAKTAVALLPASICLLLSACGGSSHSSNSS